MKFAEYKKVLTVGLALVGASLPPGKNSFAASLQLEAPGIASDVTAVHPSLQERRLVDVPSTILYELSVGHVDKWNAWIAGQRARYPGENVGGNIKGLIVMDAHDRMTSLKNADFSYSHFYDPLPEEGKTIFYNAFHNVDLEGSRFYGTRFEGMTFEGEIRNGDFSHAAFISTVTVDWDRDTHFRDNHFRHARFLPESYFYGVKISNSDFHGAEVSSHHWRDAEIDAATLASSPALREAAIQANTPRPSAKKTAIPPSLQTADEQIAYLLQHNRGLMWGDTHDSLAFPEAVAGRMRLFKENGVGLLFLEMVHPKDQHLIDDFYRCAPGSEAALRATIEAHWEYTKGAGDARFALILAAREAGIRTVAIGSYEGGAPPHPALQKTEEPDFLNRRWIETMRPHIEALPAGERFILYAGSLHGSYAPDRLGLDAHYGVPMITFGEKDRLDARDGPAIAFAITPSLNRAKPLLGPLDGDFTATLPRSPYQGKGYGTTEDLAEVIGLRRPLRACKDPTP